MLYRRLGRTGLKLSLLSLGSWVTYHNQVEPGRGRRDDGRGVRRRRQLLRQRRGLCRRPQRGVDGPGAEEAGLAAAELRGLDQVLLGPGPRRRKRQPQGHAEPQVPAAGHRRLAGALRSRAHRRHLLPSPRPAHADRRDRARDERHHHAGQGAVLGHQRMGRRRHPRRVGAGRPPWLAQAGGRAAAVPPVPPPARRAGVRAAVRRHRPGPDDLEPAGVGPADRQVRRRACPRAAAVRCRPWPSCATA